MHAMRPNSDLMTVYIKMFNGLTRDVARIFTVERLKTPRRRDRDAEGVEAARSRGAEGVGSGDVYQFVCNLRCGQRGIPAPVKSHWIGLN